jgi:hypothetical protein
VATVLFSESAVTKFAVLPLTIGRATTVKIYTISGFQIINMHV